MPLAIVNTPLPIPCNTTKTAAAGPPTNASTSAPIGWQIVASRADTSGWNRRKKLNSNTRAPTCAGPINAPAAIATAEVVPAASSSTGRCAAMAPATNQVVANTTASNGMAKRGGGGPSSSAIAALAGGGAGGTRNRFSGSPSTRCSPAQARQAPRQPTTSSSTAETGQPTVLAKPAIRVIPVIGPRAARPYSPASAANAASYSPIEMPTPITSQPSSMTHGPWAAARTTSPVASTRFDAVKTTRPPRASIARPTQGAISADSTRAAEKPPNTQLDASPNSRAIGTARTAGM